MIQEDSVKKAEILRNKSWSYFYQGDFEKAYESANQSLEISEEIGSKSSIANSYFLLGTILPLKGERSAGLDYAMKSLKLYEELGNKGWIAASLNSVGNAYNFIGELNKAIKFCKTSEMLELNNPPSLGDVVNEIFNQ